MMSNYDSFSLSLAEFGKRLGIELAMADGRCNFTVDGTVEVELDYLDDAQVVVAWSVIGLAPEDGLSGDRATALLALNELDAPNGGFSVSMDPETRRVVAHDHRAAELFDSADRLAAWIEALVALVGRVRYEFELRFPCADLEDEMDPNGGEEV